MNLEQREILTDKFIEKMQKILKTKGRDYTIDDDPFKDLREIAQDLDISPMKVMWVFARKHLSAIKNYIKTGRVESEPIEERLIDLANYCALLYALINEENTI